MSYCLVVLVDFPDQNRMQYRICRGLLRATVLLFLWTFQTKTGCSTESAVGCYELLFRCSYGLSRPQPDAIQDLPWAVTSCCFVVLMDFPDHNRMQYRICRGLLWGTVSLFLWTFQTKTGCSTESAVSYYEVLFRCSYGFSRPKPDAVQNLPWAIMSYCFFVLMDFPDQNLLHGTEFFFFFLKYCHTSSQYFTRLLCNPKFRYRLSKVAAPRVYPKPVKTPSAYSTEIYF